jgi:hypothetical protein
MNRRKERLPSTTKNTIDSTKLKKSLAFKQTLQRMVVFPMNFAEGVW